MSYQEYPIAASLRPFVKLMWTMESQIGDPKEFEMRILPDSCVELVIHYKAPFLTTFKDGSTSIQPKSFVVSQMKSFIEIAPAGAFGFISIRFTANGAYHFFALPMKEIANQVVGLEYIWGTLAGEIESRIADAKSNHERCRIVEQYLSDQLQRNWQTDKAVDYCIQELYQSKGQTAIGQLAIRTGLSNRQLLRRFDQSVGMSPKEFSRILRFIHAANLLKSKALSTHDISFLCGYYDHAHFFHEFKEFAGLTPGQFMERPDVFL